MTWPLLAGQRTQLQGSSEDGPRSSSTYSVPGSQCLALNSRSKMVKIVGLWPVHTKSWVWDVILTSQEYRLGIDMNALDVTDLNMSTRRYHDLPISQTAAICIESFQFVPWAHLHCLRSYSSFLQPYHLAPLQK